MRPIIHSGIFESERFWKHKDYCTLPTINYTPFFLSDMDQLLFVFCKKNDVLMTQNSISKAQKQYFRELDYSFNFLGLDVDDDNYYKHLFNSNYKIPSKFKNYALDVFAQIPFVIDFADKNKLLLSAANLDVVQSVNSKCWSTTYNNNFQISFGHNVYSYTELEEAIEMLLNQGDVCIVKEPFGVSGKGNFLIDNKIKQKILLRHISKQVKTGKKVEFVVEKILDKKKDFSCQFEISEDGLIKIISVNVLCNNNFSYSSSISASEDFLNFLNKNHYFETMHHLGNTMFKEGYWGHVCVDSILLLDDSIIAVLEVNARKSMSLIKSTFEKRLQIDTQLSKFSMIEKNHDINLSFQTVLEKLEKNNKLYTKESPYGIIPMCFSKNDKKFRLYFLAAEDNITLDNIL